MAGLCLVLTSCCTIFSSSRQTVTFQAPNGTKIYDASTQTKIAEVKEDNTVSVPVKKRREDKQFIARKEGYRATPFLLETSFNANSLWNILFWPGFLVDLGTEKMFRWDNTIVQIDMKPDTETIDSQEWPSQK